MKVELRPVTTRMKILITMAKAKLVDLRGAVLAAVVAMATTLVIKKLSLGTQTHPKL